MSVNIRNYVSNDHIESIGEIAKSQSAIIQTLSLDNSKLEREIERLNNIIFNQNKRNSHQRIANDNLQNKNKELNNIINELNNAYCKVITKCEEMINSRFYMNDIAIKKYADEIKDICRYYVGKAKELKGEDKE